MFGLNTQELLIIFLIILLLFGAGRIPEIGRAMGKGIRDFKRATREVEDEMQLRDDPPPRKIAKDPGAESVGNRENAPRGESTPKS